MKTKVLIIAFLILSLLGAFIKANSQIDASKEYVITSNGDTFAIKQLRYINKDSLSKSQIADETWLTYTKTGARIISYSDQAFKDISLKFGEQFKSITIKYKTDRNGPYKEYVIYLSQDVANTIKEWAKINL